MKKSLLLLLPLALLLWGCPTTEKEDDPEPEKTCLLHTKSTTASFQGEQYPTFTERYSYDEKHLLTSIAKDSAGIHLGDVTLHYSGSRLVEVNESRMRLTNDYNAKGQLVKQTRSYRNADNAYEERDYYTFSYNSKDELNEARYFYAGSGTPSLFYIWRYTYTNGNPTTIEQLSAQGNRLLLAELTFDTRERMHQPLGVNFYSPMQAPSAHYAVSYHHTDQNGNVSSETVTYTYTEQGNPATATTTDGSGFQDVASYTYSCQ